jgi:hypothetical protein
MPRPRWPRRAAALASHAGPSERTTAQGGREPGRTRTRVSALEPGCATAGAGRRAWDGGRVGRGGGSRAAGGAAQARRRAEQGGRTAPGDGAGERAAGEGAVPGWGRGRTASRERGPGPAEQHHGRGGGKGGERREEGGEAYRAGARAIGVEGETCAG